MIKNLRWNRDWRIFYIILTFSLSLTMESYLKMPDNCFLCFFAKIELLMFVIVIDEFEEATRDFCSATGVAGIKFWDGWISWCEVGTVFETFYYYNSRSFSFWIYSNLLSLIYDKNFIIRLHFSAGELISFNN